MLHKQLQVNKISLRTTPLPSMRAHQPQQAEYRVQHTTDTVIAIELLQAILFSNWQELSHVPTHNLVLSHQEVPDERASQSPVKAAVAAFGVFFAFQAKQQKVLQSATVISQHKYRGTINNCTR